MDAPQPRPTSVRRRLLARFPSWGRRTRALASFAVIALVLSAITSITSSAAPGDAQVGLPAKVVDKATAQPGDLLSYTINFTCSNNEDDTPRDGCDGAQLIDPIPHITDVYGNSVPLEFVEANGPFQVWPNGFSVDSTDPANPKVVSTAGAFPPGTSGAITITLRIPANAVGTDTQQIVNKATIIDPDKPGVVVESPPATTTVVGKAPNWTISKAGPVAEGGPVRVNRDYDWTIRVCAADAGTALHPIFDITDTLPEGFQFTSAEHGGTYVDDGNAPANVSDGTARVTWHFDEANRPPMGDDGCFQLRVKGRFPNVEESNVADAEKTNTVTGEGRTTPDGPGVGLGTDDATVVISGPVYAGGSTDKEITNLAGQGEYYVKDGDAVRFNLSGRVDSDFLLDRVTLTDGAWRYTAPGGTPVTGDGFPESFTASSVVPGTWNDPVTATIQTSVDGSTWTDLATNVASGSAAVGVGANVRFVRWVWESPSGQIRGDFAAQGQQIVGAIGDPKDDLGLYRNTSTLTVLPHGQVAQEHTASDDYVLETAQPHPGITKAASTSTRQPGQTVTYTLKINNSRDATGPLVNPILQDCIPDYFDVTTAANPPAPWVASTAPTCGSGETPIAFQYQGTLAPGASTSDVTYTVTVRGGADSDDPAPYGTYSNIGYVRPGDGGSFGHCQSTNPACGAKRDVVVSPAVLLVSKKCVRGELDDGAYRPSPECTPGEPEIVPAQTRPGNIIDYRVDMRNAGNVDAEDVVFVDILPHVDDTAIITGDPLNPRRTEYRPFLLTPIEAPAGWTVEYSTSSNPCRPEVGGPSSGCDAPGWTATPNPAAMSTYQSIRLSYDGIVTRGATASFTWQMRAPVHDATYDQGGTVASDPYEFLDGCEPYSPRTDPNHCPRAVNSFAYGADAANVPANIKPSRLFAEPPQVEVRITAPPSGNRIGDRVWFDRDFDGIQDDGETGVSDVRVELYDAQGNKIAETFTDGGGYYLFSSYRVNGVDLPLPDGDYTVRFYPPAGYLVSPSDASGTPGDSGVGTNTNDDSDVARTPTGTDAIGAYHETVAVTIGDDQNAPGGGESDLTWDMGIWRAEPSVSIDKVTKDTAWDDADYGDGVEVGTHRPITWQYTIVNDGNTRLEDVTVGDDGGPDAPFTVSDCTITDDGHNADGLHSSADAPIALNRGAEMVCTATGTSGTADYENLGDVAGKPVRDDGEPLGPGPEDHPVPEEVTDEDPSGYVVLPYDLALAKIGSDINPATGDVTYTVTVANQGALASGDYSVTDELPAGMRYVAAAPAPASVTGTPAAGETLRFDLGDLDPGDVQVVTIQARVEDFKARPYRNWAEISADGAEDVVTNGVNTPTRDVDSVPDDDATNDGDYGPVGDPSAIDNESIDEAGVGPDAPPAGEDDADIADVTLDIRYDLALAKVAVKETIGLGEQPSFTVRVYNQGNVRSGAYTVRDQLPTGLSFDAAGSSAACQPAAGDQLVCSGTDLAPGEFEDFTIATTIDGSPADWSTAPWRNWAEIDTDSAQELYGVDDVDSTPESVEDNGVGKDDTEPGDDFVDVAEAGPTYSGADEGDEDDNDAAVVETSVRYDLALAKVAAATPPTQTSDATITYTITVQNQGTVPSGAYEVTDLVPDGLRVDAPTGSSVVENADGTTTVTFAGTNLEPGEVTTFTVETTVVDLGKRPYRNHAEISDDSAQELYRIDDADSTPDTDTTNDGDYGPVGDPDPDVDNIDISEAGEGDDPEDDADIADVTFPLTYDLALAKVADATTTTYDGTVTYTVTVQNQGVLASREFTVTDWVPEGLTVVDGSISDGGTLAGGEITWTIANLAPGHTKDLTFSVRIADITKRPFRNIAEITADGADTWSVPGDPVRDVDSTPDDDPTNDGDYGPVGDPSSVDNGAITEAGNGDDPEDDADIADFDVPVTYDLALVKTVDSPTMTYDGVATFTVLVENQGNVPSGVFTVTDELPEGMGFVSASAGGVVSDDGRTVTWVDLASLDPGEQVAVELVLEITDITKRPFLNVAEITEDSAGDYSTPTEEVTDVDSVPGDEETSEVDNTEMSEAGEGEDEGFDDEDVAVVGVPITYDLAIDKELVPGQTYALDGDVRYRVTVTNEGNVPSGAYSFTDTLPKGMTFVSASHGGTANGQVVTWVSRPSLDPGEHATVEVVARITERLTGPYRNWVQITEDSADDYSTEDEKVTDVDSVPDNGEQGEDDDDAVEIPIADVSFPQPPGGGTTPQGQGRQPSRGALSRTGADVVKALAAATVLVALGGAFLTLRRRRRTA